MLQSHLMTDHPITLHKFDFLVALYITCIMIAELMGSKTFPLVNLWGYQLNASVAILVLPLIFSVNDIIVEVYGKARAKSVVRAGLVMIGFLIVFALIATALPPSTRSAVTEPAYQTIFHQSIRIALSSLTAFALAEFLDIWVFAALRRKLGTSKLWFRNNVSNFISQLVDTTVFMTLAFYAFDRSLAMNASFLFSLILPYWLLKCSMSIIETPLVYWGVRWLKKD